MTKTGVRDTAEAAVTTRSDRGARIGYGALAIAGLVALGAIVAGLVYNVPGIRFAELLDRHGPAVVGVPAAAAFALFLVAAFRAVEGPIQVDLFGLRMGGAGAAVLVWTAAFSAVALSIRALW